MAVGKPSEQANGQGVCESMTKIRGGRVSGRQNIVIRFASVAIAVIIASLAPPTPAAAQTSDPSSSSLSSHAQPRSRNAQLLEKRSLFFPDLAHSEKPLTSGEKFHLAIAYSISPAAFLGSAAGAAIGQASDSPAGYGQGSSAYGQRFGASMAKRASSNLIGTYFLSSVMHDDPRYFVMGDGSLKRSFKYAFRRVVIIRKDEGGEAFNWPGIIGPLAAAGLANTYMPNAQRTAGYTFKIYGLSIAASAGVNVLKEYWPTIRKKVLVPMGIGHNEKKP